ncbi:hypothetical protein [Rhizobium azibense]|nr:hypothetical protein [Rhizobium azibense]
MAEHPPALVILKKQVAKGRLTRARQISVAKGDVSHLRKAVRSSPSPLQSCAGASAFSARRQGSVFRRRRKSTTFLPRLQYRYSKIVLGLHSWSGNTLDRACNTGSLISPSSVVKVDTSTTSLD